MDSLIVLQTFSSSTEAELVKLLLKSEGINSIIQRGNGVAASRIFDFLVDTDLFVLKADFEKAKMILEASDDNQIHSRKQFKK